MRQVVLDTETTGLDPDAGHRIIEIGCIELAYRRFTGRQFHTYLFPDRVIEPGAVEVHGITNEFLADKPRFEQVADELLAFIDGAELVIHNAPFDVGFLDSEFIRLDQARGFIETRCQVLDSLTLARELHPGQRNSLDALCKRYEVDNSARELHGALLDARLLADVYLAMTGGQGRLELAREEQAASPGATHERWSGAEFACANRVATVSDAAMASHEAFLTRLEDQTGSAPVWRRCGGDATA